MYPTSYVTREGNINFKLRQYTISINRIQNDYLLKKIILMVWVKLSNQKLIQIEQISSWSNVKIYEISISFLDVTEILFAGFFFLWWLI